MSGSVGDGTDFDADDPASSAHAAPRRPARRPAWHQRLNVRLVIPILAIVVGAGTATFSWLLARQRDELVERDRERTALLNDTVTAALHAQMLGHTEKVTQEAIDRFAKSSDVTRISLLDKQGVVKFSSDPTLVGRHVPRTDSACTACHDRGGKPSVRETVAEGPEGSRSFKSMALIENEAECGRCHGSEHRALGVLLTELSMDSRLAAIDGLQKPLALVGAGVVVGVAACVFAILFLLVQRPLKTLVAGTRKIRDRDFAARVVPQGGWETRELAESFNEMAEDTQSYLHTIALKTSEVTTLYRFIERVSKNIDLPVLSRTIVDTLAESFPHVRTAALVLRSRAAPTVLDVTARTPRTGVTGSRTVRAKDVPEMSDVVPPDVAARWIAGELTAPEPFGDAAGWAVPFGSGDRDSGLIVATKEKARRFSSVEADLLRALGVHAEVAVTNARLYTLAITDDLTGLYTVRFLHHVLEREVERHRRHGRGFALVLLDLDDFKRVNDRHGHLAGNEVLRRVAAAIRSTVRDVDVVARYGGEEFAVLLPEADSAAATCAAERIRAAVERASIPVGEAVLGVTVSAGVAALPADADDSRSLLDAADRALYAAKRAGKNRVESSSGLLPAPIPVTARRS